MKPKQWNVDGCIVFLTNKIVYVLGSDLNLYIVNFEERKGLKNPLFKEGLCVQVLYLSQDGFRINEILMVVPIEEKNGEVDSLPVLPNETAGASEEL